MLEEAYKVASIPKMLEKHYTRLPLKFHDLKALCVHGSHFGDEKQILSPILDSQKALENMKAMSRGTVERHIIRWAETNAKWNYHIFL